ncbi:MAG: methionine synthase [Ruminococcus sp.]|nr:methionine synthase [Ruminococcus sp.]
MISKTIEVTSLNREETLRYLQCGSVINDDISSLIDICEAQILKVIQPRYIYQAFNIIVLEDCISVDGTSLKFYGKDIKNHLKGCDKAILMCATISSGVDRIIRMAEISDMAQALILDVLSSVAIENVCNQVDGIINEEYPQYYQTWRFSAGYGDFPIDIQRDFLNVLNAPKKIGLCVTDTNIMTPRKSVTAVMGLSTTPIEKKRLGCASCSMREVCQYRAKNLKCTD